MGLPTIRAEKIHLQRNEAAMSKTALLIVGSENLTSIFGRCHHFMMRRFMIFTFSEATLIRKQGFWPCDPRPSQWMAMRLASERRTARFCSYRPSPKVGK